MKTISVQQAYDKSRHGGLLLDVRTKPEFNAVHAEGAYLQPLDTLTTNLAKEWREKVPADQEIMLLCQSGKRATRAAKIFTEAGNSDVCVVEGGTDQWVEAKLPHERGGKTMSLERQVRIAAGIMIALGSALTYWVHPTFLILPAFVGCGLIFAGITDWCGMGLLIAKMPWNR